MNQQLIATGLALGMTGAALIFLVLRPAPHRRRRAEHSAPLAALLVESEDCAPPADNFPTAPLPVIPALPAPATAERRTFGRQDLLWFKDVMDDEGPIVLGLAPEPGGQLGVLVDVDGEAAGVRLDRFEVQGLRDALTCHLVATARAVQS